MTVALAPGRAGPGERAGGGGHVVRGPARAPHGRDAGRRDLTDGGARECVPAVLVLAATGLTLVRRARTRASRATEAAVAPSVGVEQHRAECTVSHSDPASAGIFTLEHVHALRDPGVTRLPRGDAHARAQAGAVPPRRRGDAPAPGGRSAARVRRGRADAGGGDTPSAVDPHRRSARHGPGAGRRPRADLDQSCDRAIPRCTPSRAAAVARRSRAAGVGRGGGAVGERDAAVVRAARSCSRRWCATPWHSVARPPTAGWDTSSTGTRSLGA